ncbi:MAG: molybdopterin-dependent oxidoreductase [Anaerolineae bacterium]
MHCGNTRNRPVVSRTDTWKLDITGRVAHPLSLSLPSLKSFPKFEAPIAIFCKRNSVRLPRMRQAVWTGVSLGSLLTQAQIDSEVLSVRAIAADGYETVLPLDLAQEGILAYAVDGEDLSLNEGFPLRLVIPGIYSHRMPRWIRKIELSQLPVIDTSSIVDEVQTTSHIVAPHHMQSLQNDVRFSGVAYAGRRSITRVELSIDDADWMPASLARAPRGSWTEWEINWRPSVPGDYAVKVRATDSDGCTQTDLPSPTGNSLSSGIHSIVIRVLPPLEGVNS